ncbi:hypothetical protein F5878DRAFT_643360 [Lentinula raphanica]|uniref:Uncharacterized protein n=1 Tax=Lentinula raphanica TaxID=153919 RepID=A0AA38UC84_9AGAR|nr:hypothetical protein F5880DRAFT_1508093 [Lentinula raphanica]KAJ3836686.1 hypothetical protein F5878DRAFT_643360 [Lentinula raphanica]
MSWRILGIPKGLHFSFQCKSLYEWELSFKRVEQKENQVEINNSTLHWLGCQICRCQLLSPLSKYNIVMFNINIQHQWSMRLQVLVDDANPCILYNPEWRLGGDPMIECQSTTHRSNFTANSTAKFSFIGNYVEVFGTVGSGQTDPTSYYQVDDLPISAYTFAINGWSNYRVPFYLSPLLELENHTLTITVPPGGSLGGIIIGLGTLTIIVLHSAWIKSKLKGLFRKVWMSITSKNATPDAFITSDDSPTIVQLGEVVLPPPYFHVQLDLVRTVSPTV